MTAGSLFIAFAILASVTLAVVMAVLQVVGFGILMHQILGGS